MMMAMIMNLNHDGECWVGFYPLFIRLASPSLPLYPPPLSVSSLVFFVFACLFFEFPRSTGRMKNSLCITKKRRGDAPLVQIGRFYRIDGAVGESNPRAPNDIEGAGGERAGRTSVETRDREWRSVFQDWLPLRESHSWRPRWRRQGDPWSATPPVLDAVRFRRARGKSTLKRSFRIP